jgi:hypothetical protein
MGNDANRHPQQAQQAHSIHGGIPRASPQSTLNRPVQRYTHFNKRNPEIQNHQRNQHYSHPKSSDNEVSVVLSFRAPPNAFVPSRPNPLPTDTPKWRDPNTNSANQFQWATLPTGNRNTRTQYMVAWIVVLHNPLSTVQSVERYTHFIHRNPETPLPNETKTTHSTNSATTKSAWCCPSERQPTPSLLLRRFDCLQTHPSGEVQIRIQQTNSNGRHCQQAIATLALNTWWYGSWFSTIHFLQSNQWSVAHTSSIETQKHKSPTKPTLLTFQTQRQRSQRGVVLQRVTQRLRSFCADSIVCRHTRVERSKIRIQQNNSNGRHCQQAIATIVLDTWWY